MAAADAGRGIADGDVSAKASSTGGASCGTAVAGEVTAGVTERADAVDGAGEYAARACSRACVPAGIARAEVAFE